MSIQKRNTDMAEILSGDLQPRWEPNFAWGNALAAYTLLPQGCGHWSTAVVHENGDCHDNDGHGFVAAYTGAPVYGYSGLAPYCDFTPATTDYLSVADRAELDIIGNEAYVQAGTQGLTMCCWAQFDGLGAAYGLMSKWVSAGNQRSYRLYKSAANTMAFQISNTGADVFSVAGAVVTTGVWYHVLARYIPSTELMIQVNGVRATNVVAIPATIFSSTSALEMGRTDGANYLDGRMSMMKLSRSAWNSATCYATFWQTCAMFGVRP
jgi:hypothetical protein